MTSPSRLLRIVSTDFLAFVSLQYTPARPQISLSKAAGCAPLLYNSGSQTCSSRYRNRGIDYVLLPWIKFFRISGRKFLLQWSLIIQNNNVVWFCVSPWRIAYYPREVIYPQFGTAALQVWLSASFSNRHWIAYKYFRFCSTQIYLISLETFS